MEKHREIPWPRILAEGTAIVISILLAFSIQAWWDSVQADSKTQEILDALRIEMESNLINLQDSIAHHEEIVEAVRVAQDQNSTAGVLETAVIDVEVFQPNTGALDTLIATGMLGDVDDPALQMALGAFTGFATDLRERESRAVEFRDTARRRIAAIGEPIWDSVDPVRVQADVQMLNLLTMRQAEEIAAIESARRLESHLVKLLGRLDSML